MLDWTETGFIMSDTAAWMCVISGSDFLWTCSAVMQVSLILQCTAHFSITCGQELNQHTNDKASLRTPQVNKLVQEERF